LFGAVTACCAHLPTAYAAACCTAAAPTPAPQEESGKWNSNLAVADLALNIAFSVEMVLRVVTVGSVWQYIRRPWNLFDTLMVFAGYTVFLPTAGNAGANGVRALRALRALRPLRTVTQLESLRSIVVCFLEVRARAEGRRFGGGGAVAPPAGRTGCRHVSSLQTVLYFLQPPPHLTWPPAARSVTPRQAVPLLTSVVFLLMFFLLVFGICGLQVFQEAFHHACVSDADGSLEPSQYPGSRGCGVGARQCLVGYTCTVRAPPPGWFRHAQMRRTAGF